MLTLYDQDILQKEVPPSYQRLKTTVKKFLDQKMRARNFEARNERTVRGTPAKAETRRSPSALSHWFFDSLHNLISVGIGCEWNGMEWNGMEWNGMEWKGREGKGREWNGSMTERMDEAMKQ